MGERVLVRRTFVTIAAIGLFAATGATVSGCEKSPTVDHIEVGTDFYNNPPFGKHARDPACGTTTVAVDAAQIGVDIHTDGVSNETAIGYKASAIGICLNDPDGIWRKGPSAPIQVPLHPPVGSITLPN